MTTKFPKRPKSAWRKRIVSKEINCLKPLTGKLNKINNLPADLYMKRFMAAAKKHGFRVKTLSGGRSVFYYGKGPVKLAFLSGIHGEERSGPVSLLTMLETTKKGELFDKKAISLMICPLVGFDAWNNKTRLENKKINLNCVWTDQYKRRPRYVGEIEKELLRFKPEFYVDFHEDSTITDKEPYMFRHKSNKGVVFLLQKTMGVSRKKGTWVRCADSLGTSEDLMFANGCHETTTIETPQTKPLRFRVGFDLALIGWLFKTLEHKAANYVL